MGDLRAEETCYTPQQVAKRLGLSPDVVRTRFRQVEGVFVIGDGKRKTIRIPKTVLDAWVDRHRVKGGGDR